VEAQAPCWFKFLECPKCGQEMTHTAPTISCCEKCGTRIHTPTGVEFTGNGEHDKFIGMGVRCLGNEIPPEDFPECTLTDDALILTWIDRERVEEKQAARETTRVYKSCRLEIPIDRITRVGVGTRHGTLFLSSGRRRVVHILNILSGDTSQRDNPWRDAINLWHRHKGHPPTEHTYTLIIQAMMEGKEQVLEFFVGSRAHSHWNWFKSQQARELCDKIKSMIRQFTRFCTNCGKIAADDWKFCKECGEPLENQAQADLGSRAPVS